MRSAEMTMQTAQCKNVHTVTVDPGSSPDHDKLGGELGKVKCLLGGGGTHSTCKDGTKPYYKRAPCRSNPYRQEGDERKFYDV